MTQPNLFDYTRRGTQLWILDHLTGISSRALLVLRAIDNRARGRPSVTLTREEIARFWLASVSTVQRGLEELEAADLLICERSIESGRGQQASTYRFVWSNLRAIAEGELPDDQPDCGPIISGRPVVQSDTRGGSDCTDPRVNLNRPPVQSDTPHYIPRKNRKNRNSMEGPQAADGVLETGILKNGFSFGRKLERDDFFEPERMQRLYELVSRAGLTNGSEVDRQLFFGLLVYVRRQSREKVRRKSGLLVSLLSGNVADKFGIPWRQRPTSEDVRTAARVIQRLDHGQPIDELVKSSGRCTA
jgi:hypothetical protein